MGSASKDFTQRTCLSRFEDVLTRDFRLQVVLQTKAVLALESEQPFKLALHGSLDPESSLAETRAYETLPFLL